MPKYYDSSTFYVVSFFAILLLALPVMLFVFGLQKRSIRNNLKKFLIALAVVVLFIIAAPVVWNYPKLLRNLNTEYPLYWTIQALFVLGGQVVVLIILWVLVGLVRMGEWRSHCVKAPPIGDRLLEEVKALRDEHVLERPPLICYGKKYNGIDLMKIDNEILEYVTVFTSKGGMLDTGRVAKIGIGACNVRFALPCLEEHEKAYFERLEKIAGLVLQCVVERINGIKHG